MPTMAPVFIAALMLVLLLTPYTFWDRAPHDAVYHGFDHNLLKIDERGTGGSKGVVEVTRGHLKLAAIPESNPRARLGSTPKDFNVSMSVRIVQADPGTTPLSIDLWQWKTGATHSVIFGPSPNNKVVARVAKGARLLKQEVLGTYTLGERYGVQLTTTREPGLITSTLDGWEAPPSGSDWVVLTNAAPHGRGYVELVSTMVPVRGGEDYAFGATMKLADGHGDFKMSVFWFDAQKNAMGWAPPVGWHSPGDTGGWTGREFVASAPQAAAFATLVASAENSSYFMTDFFLRQTSRRSVNLLPNGHFRSGPEGWALVGPGVRIPPGRPTIGTPHQIHGTFSIDSVEAPDLFLARLDLVWSLQAASSSGTAIADVQDYSVIVPPQTWRGSSLWAVKVNDATATRLVLALFAAGGLLLTLAAAHRVARRARRVPPLPQRNSSDTVGAVSVTYSPFTLAVVAAILAFFVLNALLFRLGYHLIDFNAAKTWAYIGARYGIAELYKLTALVTTGEPWTGAAVTHSDFPYGPTMAYLFSGIGWLYGMLMPDPRGLHIDGSGLAFALKSVNLLFVFANAILVFLILRTLKVHARVATLLAMLFLLNPAVWFVVSIWGETQPMSIFFLLLAILFTQKRQPHWTWVSLALSALSRPQLWLPSALLGLVAWRRFSVRENLSAFAWGVIVVFMLLLPLSLELTPSFVVNWIAGTLDVQTPTKEVTGFEMAASLGAYNLWPLVSAVMLGASGYERMWFPSVESLVQSWSYSQVSTLLTAVLQVLLVLYVLTMPKIARSNGGYIPAVGMSLLALLLFRTGVSGHHFILVLPLLIVTKGLVSSRMYFAAIGALTLTTFVSVAGDFTYHMQWKGIGDVWMPALYPGTNVVMRSLLNLYQTNWVITLGASANLAVFVWLGWETLRSLRVSGERHHAERLSIPAGPLEGPSTG